MMTGKESQIDRFKEAAKKIEADESDDALDKVMKKLDLKKPEVTHLSDCAMHNAPALKPGPCTCGAVKSSQ